jgi:UDP-glucose 4-epimerase
VKVLVTGAAGNLGQLVVPQLISAGFGVRTLDARPASAADGVEACVGDLRDGEVVETAMTGVEAVVHAGAIHGVHARSWTAADFWSINATGTFNVYQAAHRLGVKRVVLCSSIAVYGSIRDRWVSISDETTPAPSDVYGTTKLVAEQVARDASAYWGIQTIALRLGMFVPESFERYGFRLLFGGVDTRDVADAVRLALRSEQVGGFDSVNVVAPVPFTVADLDVLADRPLVAAERYWPGVTALVERHEHDIATLMDGRSAIWRSARATTLLGWQPRWTFDEFFRAWRQGQRELYPAGSPQWGL